MSRRARIGLGVGCLAAVVLLAAGGLVYLLSHVPEVEQQADSNPMNVVVSMRAPAEGTTWPVGMTIPVSAHIAAEEAISTAELWVDGGLVAEAELAPGAAAGQGLASWEWLPLAAGDHTLVGRARDARGRLGVSEPVHVRVTETSPAVLAYTVQTGDSLQTIAQSHGLTPEQVTQANPGKVGMELTPGLELLLPLPPIQLVQVHAPVTPEAPMGPGTPPGGLQLGKARFWLGGLLGGNQAPPAAPTLAASVQGCDVQLTFSDASDNESGFFVYRSSASQPAFTRIATLSANTGQGTLAYLDPGQLGPLTYTVAAFNPSGEASSNPVVMNITDPVCAPTEPGGEATQPLPPIEQAGGQITPPPSSNPDLAAPEISARRLEKCTVELSISDRSANEDGFHVYLWPDGEAGYTDEGGYWDWPNAHEGPDPIVLTIEEQHGHVRYYVSAYNAGGESPSNVVEAYLYDDACAGSHSAWDPDALQNGLLQLDPGVTLAYFYSRARPAQSQTYTPWTRTPSDPKAFLPVSGEPFDLLGYLGQTYGPSLVNPMYDYFLADIELWGWAGGQLTPLGSPHLGSILPNVLLACPYEEGCLDKPAYGNPTAELTIPAETKVRRREFYWLGLSAKGPGIWQLSRLPFPDGYDLNPPGLLASGTAGFRTWIDLADPQASCGPLNLGCGLRLVDQGLGSEAGHPGLIFSEIAEGRDLYLRVIPASPDPQGKAHITNTVVVHLSPVSYQPNLPSIGDYYTVEIVDLVQPKLINPPDWGCVILKTDWTYTVLGEPVVLGRAGERICPSPLPPPGDCDIWCQAEQIAKGIKDGFEWLGQQIENLKDMVVGFVADVANTISPGLCSDTCKSVMKAGLNIGITALTGLPPSLPNLDDVANKGLDYAVDYAASQVGADCNDDCKKAFRTALGPLLDQIIPKGSSPSVPEACDAGMGAQHGKQPLCLTNDLAEPAPGSHYEPAVAILRVRRGSAPTIDVKQGELNYIRLVAGGFNSNAAYASSYFDICQYGVSQEYRSDYYYPEGELALNYAPDPNHPMTSEEMYQPELVPVPWLEPGQEVTIPVVLSPATYRYYQGGVRSKCPSMDDWDYLFYAGVTRLTAQPMCFPNAGSMDFNPAACGTADHKEFENPTGPTYYVAPPQAHPAP
jgi:LysM repeat protein